VFRGRKNAFAKRAFTFGRQIAGIGQSVFASVFPTPAFETCRGRFNLRVVEYATCVLDDAGRVVGYASRVPDDAGRVLGYASRVLGYASRVLGYAGRVLGYAGRVLGYAGRVLGYASRVLGYARLGQRVVYSLNGFISRI
jgi:hypothetical protein